MRGGIYYKHVGKIRARMAFFSSARELLGFFFRSPIGLCEFRNGSGGGGDVRKKKETSREVKACVRCALGDLARIMGKLKCSQVFLAL